MNSIEFNERYARLEIRWPNSYDDEIKKLIWREVSDFSPEWMNKVLDQFIGGSRHAPLVPDFQVATALQRERIRLEQKKNETIDAKHFWDGSAFTGYPGSKFTWDEQKHFFHMIRERVKGNVADPEWECFMKMLNEVCK